MAYVNSTGLALVEDALQRLGKARLSIELAGDLLDRGRRELGEACEKIASAAVDLRRLVRQ